MKRLYGPDVYSGEGKNIFEKIRCDFGIVKVSGNPMNYDWDYINPFAKKQADDCYKKTGLLGLYHFTWGKDNPNVEADFFLKQVRKLGYMNKAMLIIDYEAQAVKKGRTWVKEFAERIYEKAGYKPVIYASGSVIVEQKLNTLGYPIWEASYPTTRKIYGYHPPEGKVWCKSRIMWQFTGTGRLNGYNGNMDLNVFYGDATKFKSYMGKQNKKTTKTKNTKKSITEIAQLVIKGKYGSGSKRKEKLEKEGYNYSSVQKKVNELMYEKAANDVIAGKYGNGEKRFKKLKAEGLDSKRVQTLVNKKVMK